MDGSSNSKLQLQFQIQTKIENTREALEGAEFIIINLSKY